MNGGKQGARSIANRHGKLARNFVSALALAESVAFWC